MKRKAKAFCVKPELAMDLISDSDDRGYRICEHAQKKKLNVVLAVRKDYRGYPVVIRTSRCKRKPLLVHRER